MATSRSSRPVTFTVFKGSTAHGKAVKWFAVFHYSAQDGERMLAFWWVDTKTGAVIQKLAVQIRAKAQDYTL